MAHTFEFYEPTALAEGGSFTRVSFNSNPKLALSAHTLSAIGRDRPVVQPESSRSSAKIGTLPCLKNSLHFNCFI